MGFQNLHPSMARTIPFEASLLHRPCVLGDFATGEQMRPQDKGFSLSWADASTSSEVTQNYVMLMGPIPIPKTDGRRAPRGVGTLTRDVQI